MNVLGHGGSDPATGLKMLPLEAEGREGIEINEASSGSVSRITAVCCRSKAQEGQSIMVNSDAHSAHAVGRYPETLWMLEEIHFPKH